MSEESIPGFVTGDLIDLVRAGVIEPPLIKITAEMKAILEDSKSSQDTANDSDSTSDLSGCKDSLQGYTAGEPNLDESKDYPSEEEKIKAYILSKWEHVSCKNISKSTGIKIGTVYSGVSRLKDRGEISRDDDHMYYIARIDAGRGGADSLQTARENGIYTGLDFGNIQHLVSGGPRYQNIRVVSGELDYSYHLSPLSVDVPYGCDVIHLDVSYGVRFSRFNWSASVSGGIHMDDYSLFCDYVSHILSSSSLYIPRDIFYEDLTKTKWYTRQLEVFSDDFTPHHISGYYDTDTLRGVVCKIYGKADCVRRENQIKRLPDNTTLADLSVAVRGSASQIDSNVRVKQLEVKMQHLLDSQSYLVSKVGDLTRAVEAFMS